jgi:hypothetical protein
MPVPESSNCEVFAHEAPEASAAATT